MQDKPKSPTLSRARRGNALIEFSLLLPWLIFLFTAVFDMGFYYYALESVENGARAAALHISGNSSTASDQGTACSLAISQLRGLPNIGQSFSSSCNAQPVIVTTGYCATSAACSGGSASPDSAPAAYVSVTYQMPPLFHFPVQGLASITRTSTMRMRDNNQ